MWNPRMAGVLLGMIFQENGGSKKGEDEGNGWID